MEFKRHKSLAIRKTVVAQALAVAFGTVAFSGGMISTAYAQSNATGTIFSRVEAGSTVVIENVGTGLKRTLTADSTGRVTFTSLPTGIYKATLTRNGAVAGTQDGIEVLLGQGAEVSFAPKSLQTVQVVGQRTRIDVSNTNNGANFTAKELASIPAIRNVDSIIQLAPNTTRADSRYAGGASIGGGGPSENSYYINGFPVTNALTQLGGSELPFGAIAQAQVLTGGFGAEFGRSVGGVVNVVTKSGTNTWEAGVQLSVVPASLRQKPDNQYYPATGDPLNATDGTLYRARSDNTLSETKLGAYISGPLIEDKLLMFVAVEQTKNTTGSVTGLRTSQTNAKDGWLDQESKTTRFLGKLDWNLTNDHRLEWTSIGDRPEAVQNFSGYDYATGARNGVVTSGGYFKNMDNVTAQGADVNILKYTGDLTSDLTLTALVGQSKANHINDYNGYNPAIPGATFANLASRAPGITYPELNPISNQRIVGPGSEDTVKGYRVDLEWRLGKHTLRAGVDDNKLSSSAAGEYTSGGFNMLYTKTSVANANNPAFKPTFAKNAFFLADPVNGPLAAQGYYARKTVFNDLTDAYSDQAAQYIEDKYQITKDILLTAGLRHETYENRNGDNQVFLKNDQMNPRFAAAWDVNGDSSFKVYGSAGRYSLQIPTHIAVRGASRSTFTREFFSYTGVDQATGQPTGVNQLAAPNSNNNEYGQAKEYQSVSSTNLDPTYQNEITLGFERALTPAYNGGVKLTYRTLQSTIDDFCDQRPIDAWAARNNVDTTNWRGFNCASINPGKAQTFLFDFNNSNPDLSKVGKFTTVALTKEDLGLPTAERTYTAVDMFLEHALRNGWYGKINYTWSQSKGNTEGQTLSDVAQTDVAATQTWDHFELMENAYGLLPGNRTHQIKAYGFYEMTNEWQIGANLLLASGRPKNCLGYYAGTSLTQGAVDYGSSYHYCNGKPAPRGSEGELPWDKRLDLSVAYKPSSFKGLELKADITNVFNAQTAQTIDETYNNESGASDISPTYQRVISTTAPRSVRFTATYSYKF